MNKISRERFEFLKQKHWQLWDWLAANPDKEKEDCFVMPENEDLNAFNNCFACQLDRG